MKESFEQAVEFVLKWETGAGQCIYVNNPRDPGGETKYGISKRAHPGLDIKGLTVDKATAIYRSEYWRGAGCDDLPYPLDVAVFNLAVTSGPGTAKRIYMQSSIFADFIIRCMKFYVDIKGQVLEGWINRAFDLYITFKPKEAKQ